jgi:hypothetical protein
MNSGFLRKWPKAVQHEALRSSHSTAQRVHRFSGHHGHKRISKVYSLESRMNTAFTVVRHFCHTTGILGLPPVLPLYQRFPRGSPLYLQYPCGFTAVHYGNPVPLALPKAFHCVRHGLHSGKPWNPSIHQYLRYP